MHSNSDNIKFASDKFTNKVVDELCDSLISRYQGKKHQWKKVNLFLIQFR